MLCVHYIRYLVILSCGTKPCYDNYGISPLDYSNGRKARAAAPTSRKGTAFSNHPSLFRTVQPSLAVLWQVLDYALHALVDMLRCRRPALALVSDSFTVVLRWHSKPTPQLIAFCTCIDVTWPLHRLAATTNNVIYLELRLLPLAVEDFLQRLDVTLCSRIKPQTTFSSSNLLADLIVVPN